MGAYFQAHHDDRLVVKKGPFCIWKGYQTIYHLAPSIISISNTENYTRFQRQPANTGCGSTDTKTTTRFQVSQVVPLTKSWYTRTRGFKSWGTCWGLIIQSRDLRGCLSSQSRLQNECVFSLSNLNGVSLDEEISAHLVFLFSFHSQSELIIQLSHYGREWRIENGIAWIENGTK